MTEFSVGDRVLVPGKITGYHSDGEVEVTCTSGEQGWHHPTDLRPDTGGRDLTANDVADAVREWTAEDTHYAQIAEELTRIARGDAGSAGDDTAPPAAAEPKAWVTREQDCHDLSCRFAASTHTHNDPRAAAGPRADDEPDVMEPLRREMRDGMADYEARAATGPRAGDTAPDDELTEEHFVEANERMGQEIDRLRSEVAALRDAGNALADSVSRFLMSPEDHDDRAKMQNAARAWRSAAGEATT